MKILAIETSCDETGISILEVKGGKKNPTFKILADELSSQVKIHAQYGGVHPSMAKREHIKNLPILLEKVLKETKLKKVDVIMVTSGPGLEPALWTGIVFAEQLGKEWSVPVIPVNHMEGHVLSVFGKEKGKFKIPKVSFPSLSLLISGGHTELVMSKSWREYKIIGETLDDAAGEAFDKVARMLELPYPGGPQISNLAEKARGLGERGLGSATVRARAKIQQNFMGAESEQASGMKLPRPMLYTKNFDFSFSGLKTAVLYLIKKIGKLDDKTKMAIAKEFEDSVVEVLTEKTLRAAKDYGIKTLIVAGGVSANTELRKILEQKIKERKQKFKLLFPAKKLTTDNSLMIGIAGYFKFIENPKKRYKIKAEGGLRL